MFCWHRWKVVETEILPSLLEQIADQEIKMDGGGNPSHKAAIVTKRCEKCGTEKVVRV